MLRIVFFFSFLFFALKTNANSITIGNNHPVKKIKEAIALAKENDTIFIDKGIYKEGNIVISKSLKIIGINNPVIDGESRFEIFTVSAKYFLIMGITFQNSGYSSMNDFASIKVIDASGFVIEGNTIINASFAIHVSNCSNFAIKNNVITGKQREEQNTGNAIHLWKCNHAFVNGNKVSGHRDGIYFEFVTDSEIKNNYSTKNMRYGLHFMFSNNDTYTQNTFIENGAGVAVMFSHHVNMIQNTFENNQGGSAYGILLKEISDGEITKNIFKNNTIGIYMEGTNRISVTKNNFEGNGWGFKIQASCSDINVERNKFIGNTFDVATNGTLVLNKFYNNYWDKYEGYDLNKDGVGDVPYRPVSLYSMIAEQMPYSIMLFRSFMVMLLERTEKAVPGLTPIDLKDDAPLMKVTSL
ncbi:MAG: nitrous oxide reductase family maturation protein NosD [Bacteroidia bacterium]